MAPPCVRTQGWGFFVRFSDPGISRPNSPVLSDPKPFLREGGTSINRIRGWICVVGTSPFTCSDCSDRDGLARKDESHGVLPRDVTTPAPSVGPAARPSGRSNDRVGPDPRNFRKATESTIQLQQEMTRQWFQQWASIPGLPNPENMYGTTAAAAPVRTPRNRRPRPSPNC